MPRKVVCTADAELTAERIEDAVAKLTRHVKAAGGYVAESGIEGQGGAAAGLPRVATCKVRVPVDRFDAFMTGLGELGEVGSSHVSSQDVTDEFYDLEARLRNKRAEEARLLRHLDRSTTKLSDILLVEEALARVREEIERMEGRRRLLADQSDLSTVTVTIREAAAFPQRQGAPSLATQARRTFADSLGALGAFGRGLTLVVVALVPWAAIGAGVGIPVGRVAARRRARKEKQRTGDTS
jgi:hypothetical protein